MKPPLSRLARRLLIMCEAAIAALPLESNTWAVGSSRTAIRDGLAAYFLSDAA
jgi:hypothetical protein